MNNGKYIDSSTMIVMVITFFLFAGAVFSKGFTHDLLLESGVFLVSVKLVIMAYRHGKSHETLRKELGEIKELVKEIREKTDEK